MSLCSTSSWSSAKPGIAPRNNRHLATLLYNSSPAKFQAQYDTAAPGRPRVRPCQGLRERVDLLYNNYAARCLDFLLPILEFLRLIIQHHGVWNHGRISSLILTTSVRIIAHDSRRKSCHNFVYHRKSSLVIIHKYTASQYTSSAGVLPFSKWRILPRIRTACFARISRGVPRVAFSFTITLYLVRMKKK